MAKQLRRRLNRAQQQEIMQLYRARTASIVELSDTYNIGASSIYRLLHRHQIPLHRGLVDSDFAAPRQTTEMAVVVDKNDMVQSAQAVRRKGQNTWEIKYTGTIFIDADDVEEAIQEARKIGMVKRIYSVRVKST